MRIKISNGQIVETTSKKGLEINDFDGLYHNYYGRTRNIEYNGKTYNCFPIMKISEDLSKVEEIAMFGCEGGRENTCYDDYLDMPVDYEIWSNLKPFRELMENNWK